MPRETRALTLLYRGIQRDGRDGSAVALLEGEAGAKLGIWLDDASAEAVSRAAQQRSHDPPDVGETIAGLAQVTELPVDSVLFSDGRQLGADERTIRADILCGEVSIPTSAALALELALWMEVEILVDRALAAQVEAELSLARTAPETSTLSRLLAAFSGGPEGAQ